MKWKSVFLYKDVRNENGNYKNKFMISPWWISIRRRSTICTQFVSHRFAINHNHRARNVALRKRLGVRQRDLHNISSSGDRGSFHIHISNASAYLYKATRMQFLIAYAYNNHYIVIIICVYNNCMKVEGRHSKCSS